MFYALLRYWFVLMEWYVSGRLDVNGKMEKLPHVILINLQQKHFALSSVKINFSFLKFFVFKFFVLFLWFLYCVGVCLCASKASFVSWYWIDMQAVFYLLLEVSRWHRTLFVICARVLVRLCFFVSTICQFLLPSDSEYRRYRKKHAGKKFVSALGPVAHGNIYGVYSLM